MDNEELEGVKFSQFPSATPGDSDEVVGLRAGGNARFSVANFILAVRQGLANIFVPLSRTINNKALSSDITLDASDVGAVDADDVGVADGVASLDSTGKVPGTQLDLSGKQDTITASGILKGDGAGGVSAATPGTDYQAPLTAGTDYATPAQLADKANQAQLATVESGSTASRAYAVGEYFCWNGLLYRVTSAISSGGTFTVNANCEQVTVGAVLTAIDSKMYQVTYQGNATYTYTMPAGRWFLIYANRANTSGVGLYAVHITGANGYLTTIFETSNFTNSIVLSLSGRNLSVQVKSTYATLNILNFGGV